MAVLTDHVSTYHIGVFFFAQSPESRPDSAGTVDLANLANITKILQGILEGASLHALWSRRLSERACYQLYQASHPQYFTYRGLANHPAIKAYEKEHSLELVFQPFNCTAFRHGKQLPYRFPIRFAVFDMDSTLINQEIIDELAASIGATQAVAAITERAMAGEVDFAESLKARVALLKGIRTDVWDHLKQRITFSEGVPELCKALKKLGVKTAVLSGGFIEMATWAKEILGLDYAYANHVRPFQVTVFPMCHSPPFSLAGCRLCLCSKLPSSQIILSFPYASHWQLMTIYTIVSQSYHTLASNPQRPI